MANTPYIDLVKPAGTDKALISVINANSDKIDSAVGGVQDALAIVCNGNTHGAISSGQYVYVRAHETLQEGLYTANSNIAANAALSSSNLTANSSGGLNALNEQIGTLDSKINNLIGIGTMIALTGVQCPSGSFVTIGSYTPTATERHVYLIEATVNMGEAGNSDRNNIFMVDVEETDNNTAGNSVMVKGARAYIQKVRTFVLASTDTVYFRVYQNSGSTVTCSVTYRILKLA